MHPTKACGDIAALLQAVHFHPGSQLGSHSPLIAACPLTVNRGLWGGVESTYRLSLSHPRSDVEHRAPGAIFLLQQREKNIILSGRVAGKKVKVFIPYELEQNNPMISYKPFLSVLILKQDY